MVRADCDIAIVGAGIAGAALALALRDSGYRVMLLEAGEPVEADTRVRARVTDFDSRVSALTPASRDFLFRHGAWNQSVAARACPYTHMHVWDGDGTGSIDFDCTEVSEPALGYILENSVLLGRLHRLLGEGEAVAFRTGATLTEVSREGHGAVRLALETGAEIHARLVVAADGARSRVRALSGFRTREWDYGHRAVVATVATEHEHGHTARQRFMTSGPLAFLPLAGEPQGRFCSIVWSLQDKLAEDLLALDDAAFKEALGLAFEHRLGTILSSSPRLAFPLRQRHATDYVLPGVALLGDAAHTLHPLAGQGVNLGLLDVAVLAEELLVGRRRGVSPGDPAVLRRYQRRRKGHNLAAMLAMDAFKQLFGQRAPLLRWLRNTGMNAVGRAQPLKQRIIRQALGRE